MTLVSLIDRFEAAGTNERAQDAVRLDLFKHLRLAGAPVPGIRYAESRFYPLGSFIDSSWVSEDLMGLRQYDRKTQEIADYLLGIKHRCTFCDHVKEMKQPLLLVPAAVLRAYDQLSADEFVAQLSSKSPGGACPNCTASDHFVQTGSTNAPKLLNFLTGSTVFRPSRVHDTINWKVIQGRGDKGVQTVRYELIAVIYHPNQLHFTADIRYSAERDLWHHYDGMRFKTESPFIGTTPKLDSSISVKHLIYERSDVLASSLAASANASESKYGAALPVSTASESSSSPSSSSSSTASKSLSSSSSSQSSSSSSSSARVASSLSLDATLSELSKDKQQNHQFIKLRSHKNDSVEMEIDDDD